MILNKDQPLFIHTFGRAIRVTAIFQSADQANQFMEINPEQGRACLLWPLRICGAKLRPWFQD